MIAHDTIEKVRRGLGAFQEPTLSLYAALGHNGFQRAAQRARAEVTLRALDVPDDVRLKALRAFEAASYTARTLAVFASRTELQTIELAPELPVTHPDTGYFDARWGKPYLAPFLLALDRHPRRAVVYVDAERWRLFEIFLGDIAEVDHAMRPIHVDEWARLEASTARAPAYEAVLTRPGPPPSRRELDRFFALVAERTEGLMARRSIDAFALLCPPQFANRFMKEAPRTLQNRCVASGLSGLSSPDARPEEVLEKTEPVLREIDGMRQRELLDRVASEGVSGAEACIDALRAGELSCLIVPWMSGAQAFLNPRSGAVEAEREASIDHAYPLRDVVADLVVEGKANLEFVEAENQRRVLREFDGMAGLLNPRPALMVTGGSAHALSH